MVTHLFNQLLPPQTHRVPGRRERAELLSVPGLLRDSFQKIPRQQHKRYKKKHTELVPRPLPPLRRPSFQSRYCRFPGPHEGSACSRKATACLRDPQVEERLGKHQRRLQFLWRKIRLERTPTASLPQDQVSKSLVSVPGLHPAAHLTLLQGILLWLQEERRGCSHHTPSQGGSLDPELMD